MLLVLAVYDCAPAAAAAAADAIYLPAKGRANDGYVRSKDQILQVLITLLARIGQASGQHQTCDALGSPMGF